MGGVKVSLISFRAPDFNETSHDIFCFGVGVWLKLCYTEITYFKEELLVYGNRGWS